MLIRKKLALMTTSSFLLLGLTVGGGTYAIFTSQDVNQGNSFAAGIINLQSVRDMGDSFSGPMFYNSSSDPSGSYPTDGNPNKFTPPGAEAVGGWSPGDSATRALNISNTGTLAAQITRIKANVNNLGVTSGDAYEHFIKKMNVKIEYPAQNRTIYNGSLDGLIEGITLPVPILDNPNSTPINITFTASLDKSAENVIQGKTFVFDFELFAEQVRNN